MIAQLRGTLADKRPNQVLVDVGGVGYQVQIPLSTFYALGELHAEVTLLTYLHVREDAMALYGFLTAHEKHLFERLISVSGVGPVLALKILSGVNVEDLVPAVREGDVARLTRIPGVGRKTAERIVVELRDKLAAMGTRAETDRPATATGMAADVVSALFNLGYERRAAEQAVDRARKDGASGKFEDLLRVALHELSAPAGKGAGAGR